MDYLDFGRELVKKFLKSKINCPVCEEEILGNDLTEHLVKVHKKSNSEIWAIGVEIGEKLKSSFGLMVD